MRKLLIGLCLASLTSLSFAFDEAECKLFYLITKNCYIESSQEKIKDKKECSKIKNHAEKIMTEVFLKKGISKKEIKEGMPSLLGFCQLGCELMVNQRKLPSEVVFVDFCKRDFK